MNTRDVLWILVPALGRTNLIKCLSPHSRWEQVVLMNTSFSSKSKIDAVVSQTKAIRNQISAIAVCGDLRIIEVPVEIVKSTLSAFDPYIDILVKNAGMALAKSLMEIVAEEFTDVYDINVRAAHLLTQAVAPAPQLRSPGRIINILSVGTRVGFADLSVYCSSKAALECLTRVWAAEFGATGTTVNAVALGPIESDILANILKEIIDMQKASAPVKKRVGESHDVAEVVSRLASAESSWIRSRC